MNADSDLRENNVVSDKHGQGNQASIKAKQEEAPNDILKMVNFRMGTASVITHR